MITHPKTPNPDPASASASASTAAPAPAPAPIQDTASAVRPAARSTAAERTGARTDEAAGLIAGARERIDTLDDRIIGLVHERMAVSAVIQDARISSGGRRVNLARETEVLTHFRDALGKPGTSLAMTLLELCRGRV
ncbi:chorismate mutase [Streptomyces sp. NPDC001889]